MPPTPPTPRARCSTTSTAGAWDDDLLDLFGVPRAILPEVRDCDAVDYGETEPSILGAAVPIRGIAGDQQAATIGQACFAPGMVKATYGTGCFALLNTGAEPVASKNRLLTHRRLSARRQAHLCAGRRHLHRRRGGAMAARRPAHHRVGRGQRVARGTRPTPGSDVYLVPAFVGLGAPYWEPEARGALFGLTRGTRRNELARAALESVCYQTRDLLEAMRGDWTAAAPSRCCASTAAWWRAIGPCSSWPTSSMHRSIGRPVLETTALGAAWLAGRRAGVWPDADGFAKLWKLERAFKPTLAAPERERKYAGWQRAVRAVLQHAEG